MHLSLVLAESTQLHESAAMVTRCHVGYLSRTPFRMSEFGLLRSRIIP